MEKTAKKKKKSKSLKRRIGVIAVGGLSLVLTVCLSVGATLAWFAGSTWASKSMFMGGPVYVEMSGRGTTEGDGSTANWVGGDGNLDIKANAARTSGTVMNGGTGDQTAPTNVLLPGQKLEIYSQARVYSTNETNTVDANRQESGNSGANTTNITNGVQTYQDETGRITTTTSSVLRARFSINVEFDSTVGFNNFTDRGYADNYPVQSKPYTGHHAGYVAIGGDDDGDKYHSSVTLPWQDALTTVGDTFTAFSQDVDYGTRPDTSEGAEEGDTVDETANDNQDLSNDTWVYVGRRDGVNDTATGSNGKYTGETANSKADAEMTVADVEEPLFKIRNNQVKSIYKWKYVSAYEYGQAANYMDPAKIGETSGDPATPTAAATAWATNTKAYMKMGYPFNGGDTSTNSNGYYGVWILEKDGTGKYSGMAESDAFYKDRCNAYLSTYIEHYKNEYGNWVTRSIGSSLTALDKQLNSYFVKLVNDSSDAIQNGFTNGFNVTDGQKDYSTGTPEVETPTDIPYDADGLQGDAVNASWLYIDPTIGNDTNTNEISTSTGGWWYLVESSGTVTSSGNGDNAITTAIDSWTGDTGKEVSSAAPITAALDPAKIRTFEAGDTAFLTTTTTGENPTTTVNALGTFTRKGTDGKDSNKDGKIDVSGTVPDDAAAFDASKENIRTRLYAKLFEIKPNIITDTIVGYNNGTPVYKTVSEAFPFVNGTFALPTDALTNLFANAKLSFQISFQALQAFFPYTETIDKINYTSPLLGTAKALNIGNAIPIFNEAFDYSETFTDESVTL